ncbi:MAG TPA: hypothetical protein PLC98_17050 [Anaerolineales bacterium]|nr:hypothetical protein [Anaerolineales bacterium]
MSSVEININRAKLKLSLDGMSNRIAMAHTIQTGSSATRSTTSWAEDAISIDRYGIRELMTSSQATNTAAAEAARDDMLAQVGRPIASVTFNGQPGQVYATIDCLGWWSTLGWRYYSNPGTGTVANETQIAAILAAGGQFMSGVEVGVATGLASVETRNGDKTALACVTDLMASGVSGGRRLLATVHPRRNVEIVEQPAATAGDQTWAIDTTGAIRNGGGHDIQPYVCPAGYWASVGDYLPALGRDERGVGFSRFFVEEAEYVCASSEYRPVASGMVNPWTIASRIMRG